MITTKTPLRVSLVGSITDIPDYYLRHGGSNISATIDKYVDVSVEQLDTPDLEIETDIHSEVAKTVDQVLHPLVRECLRWSGVKGGVHIKVQSDVTPYGSGLGASSALTVGLLHALFKLQDECVVSPDLLFANAVHVELNRVGSVIGVQDQYFAVHGGFRRLVYNRDGSITSRSIPLPPSECFLLFDTGLIKTASAVIKPAMDRSDLLDEIKGIVPELESALLADDINTVGVLLNKVWYLKRCLTGATGRIDRLYDTAIKHGALGGKLCGSGGGGHFLFIAPPHCHAGIISGLTGLGCRHVPFTFVERGSHVEN